MSRHKPKKRAPTRKQEESAAPLRQALARRKKAELVDVLVELAQADRGVLRQLTARFDVAAAPVALVAATRQAIADATDFDEREMNCNFAYDYEAYGEVKRNLSRLIASGQLRLAMQLALELMKQGSYQVEMSDEGLMTDDIEDCLSVVHQALAKGDLPAAEVIAWCSAMLDSDHVGFIAREPFRHCASASRGPGHDKSARHTPPRPKPIVGLHPSKPYAQHRATFSVPPGYPGLGASTFAPLPEGHALWLGCVVTGLSMASIFPTTFALAQRRLAITGAVASWLIVGSAAGSMVLPWLMGQLFGSLGPRALILALWIDLLAATGVVIGLLTRSARCARVG